MTTAPTINHPIALTSRMPDFHISNSTARQSDIIIAAMDHLMSRHDITAAPSMAASLAGRATCAPSCRCFISLTTRYMP